MIFSTTGNSLLLNIGLENLTLKYSSNTSNIYFHLGVVVIVILVFT